MKVIHYKNLPGRLPLVWWILTYLVYRDWGNEYIVGIMLFIGVIGAINSIYGVLSCERVDIFEEKIKK